MSEIVIVRTGTANLASVLAGFERLGAKARLVEDAAAIEEAQAVVLPGVGAFSAALPALRRGGMGDALRKRIEADRPTLAVCLGLQLLAEGSEEGEGEEGLGILKGRAQRFPDTVRVPQLGWNRVTCNAGDGMLEDGAAYFANSYRLTESTPGWRAAWSDHAGRFIAAIERGHVLACQFHPELSGEWGKALLERWWAKANQSPRRNQSPSGPNVSALTDAPAPTERPETPIGGLSSEGLVSHPSGPNRNALTDAQQPIKSPETPAASRSREGPTANPQLMSRIIPCLDVRDGRVVKGVKFQGLRDAGSPADLAAEYERQGADEIVILDVAATPQGRGHQLETVRSVRRVLSIPLTVGGGVRRVEDAAALLEAGADKVGVNTAAVTEPGLVTELSRRFGAQCTVVAIDARGQEGGGWEVVVRSGKEGTGRDAVEWAKEVVERGAGEILLTSWDRDGTRSGYELDLLAAVSSAVHVPVIASGGAAHADHLVEALRAGADAVLAASIFHDGDTTVASLKHVLASNGIEVRQ